MAWTASVISGSNWLSITAGASGTNSGTIKCFYIANTGTTDRMATIRVTAAGSSGSPMDITITQKGIPVLLVTPSSQNLSKDAGMTSFNVYNTGSGTMTWTASVISGSNWLSITSGTSGTNTGTIQCAYTAYTGTPSRIGKIRVMASGANGSPVDVVITQEGAPVKLIISGDVKTSAGDGIFGVMISLSNNGGSASTDISGHYSITVPYNYSGAAAASKTGYTFTPPSKTYSNVTSNQSSEDYMGTSLSANQIWGIWPDGIQSWEQSTEQWSMILQAKDLKMIASADVDGDMVNDIIGVWPSGLWVQYSSNSQWVKLSAASPTWLTVGDINDDGRSDIIGNWNGSGVYYRDSVSGKWQSIAGPAQQLTSGTIEGIRDDLVGVWDTGLWVRNSAAASWQKIDSRIPIWITTGDMTGSGISNIIGSYDMGKYYRDSVTAVWTKITSSAEQLVSCDLNGDSRDDLIGIWPDGVWIRYTVSNTWKKISSYKPLWITTGKSIDADAIRSRISSTDPAVSQMDVFDLSSEGPEGNIETTIP